MADSLDLLLVQTQRELIAAQSDTITRLQAALEAVKAYYIDANPTKLTEAYVCDLVCDAISGRGVTP